MNKNININFINEKIKDIEKNLNEIKHLLKGEKKKPPIKQITHQYVSDIIIPQKEYNIKTKQTKQSKEYKIEPTIEEINEIVKKEKKNKYTPQELSDMKNLINLVLFDNFKIINDLTDKEETKASKVMLNIQKIGILPFNELLNFLKYYLKYNDTEINNFSTLFYYNPKTIGDKFNIKITKSENPEDIRKESISDIKQFMFDINDSKAVGSLNKMKENYKQTKNINEAIEKTIAHILELEKKAEEIKPKKKEKKPKTVYDRKQIEANKQLINDYTFNEKMSNHLLTDGAKNLFKLQKKGGDDDDVSDFSIVYLMKEPTTKELEQLRDVFKIKQKK